MAGFTPKPGKSLSVFSLVMINVIAVDSLRSLPFSAVYGFSLVFYYLLAALMFFIPVALISAELATAMPNKGGIYVWVREAFGELWGFVVIWLQWVYNIVWYPTILSFIAATIAYLIDPSLADSKTFMLLMVLSLFWGATLLNCFGMELSSLVSTIGALVGTLLPMILIIGLGLLWLGQGHVSQVDFHSSSFLPSLDNPKSLGFLTALIFGLVGIEMSAVHADEVKNPGRAYPRAILYSTIIILLSLVLSSLAIAIVVPHNDLSVMTGLLQAYHIFFTALNIEWAEPIIALLIIIGGFGGVATWIIGPTKGLLVAAQDGNAPAFLAQMNSKGVPVTMLMLQGAIFTVICIVFLLMPTVSSSYQVLTVMTAQLAMLVYVALFAAAVWLRYKHADTPRPYRIPGGNWGIIIICCLGLITCFTAIGLGFIPPEQLLTNNVTTYELILIIGMIVMSVPPLIIHACRGYMTKKSIPELDSGPSQIEHAKRHYPETDKREP
ncbi:MAG: amino acid permease [Pseudomonadota bacterium]|nr:amino acid permease [Pseudomonadota bacterium]